MKFIKKFSISLIALGFIWCFIIFGYSLTAHAANNSWTATHVGSGNRRTYAFLNARERAVYDYAVYYAYDGNYSYGDCTRLASDAEAYDVWTALACDYPEVYFCVMRTADGRTAIAKDCRYADYNIGFASSCRFNAGVGKNARYAYYTVAGHITYAYDRYIDPSTYVQNDQMPKVLYSQTGVCKGYAAAFQLLCNVNSVECYTVFGSNHAWNVIKYTDGNYYIVDTTWGRGNSFKTINEGMFCTYERCARYPLSSMNVIPIPRTAYKTSYTKKEKKKHEEYYNFAYHVFNSSYNMTSRGSLSLTSLWLYPNGAVSGSGSNVQQNTLSGTYIID